MEKETYDEGFKEFVTLLKSFGVKENTIKQLVEEIREYIEKEQQEQLEEIRERWDEILRRAYYKDEEF